MVELNKHFHPTVFYLIVSDITTYTIKKYKNPADNNIHEVF